MTTKPPSAIKLFPEDSLEKKVYNLVESFKENLPTPNDRNRLAYSLIAYLKGEGDEPLVAVKNNKLNLKNISKEELAEKLDVELKKIRTES